MADIQYVGVLRMGQRTHEHEVILSSATKTSRLKCLMLCSGDKMQIILCAKQI